MHDGVVPVRGRGQGVGVADVAADLGEAGPRVRSLEAGDHVTPLGQLQGDVATEQARGAGHEDPHGSASGQEAAHGLGEAGPVDLGLVATVGRQAALEHGGDLVARGGAGP